MAKFVVGKAYAIESQSVLSISLLIGTKVDPLM